jgi:Rrf2 family protein
MFSKTIGYSIRAAIFLTTKREEIKNYSPMEIAQNLNVPSHYIGKILQQLAKVGLIDSQKGPKGGFRANEQTLKCSVFEIFEVADNAMAFKKCSLGLKECNSDKPCPIHNDIINSRDEIKNKLVNRTILELAKIYETSDKHTLS